jgi:cell wall-associated NlpC family hydrolase
VLFTGARRTSLVCALIAAGALALATPAQAQTSSHRSLAETARDTVKDVATSAWHSARELTTFALGLIGVDYKYGGTSPKTGLDCSGLVGYVFQQVTGVTLPRTARELSRVGDRIGLDELKPGDLVFFNTRRFDFSHVGIYLGDNRFIHAPSRGREVEVVSIETSFWQKRFNGARRLASVMPELLPALVAEAQAAALVPPLLAGEEPQLAPPASVLEARDQEDPR